MTIYRDNFLGGMVDEVSLERRMVRFRIEDISTDVLRNVEVLPIRERTWSERVQDSDVAERGKEEDAALCDTGPLNACAHKADIPQKKKADSASPGGGISLLDLPPYLFKGVIVTHKKNEAFVFIRSCQVAGDVFVYTEDFDKDVKKEGADLVGRIVLFTVKDSGKKSLEASRVELAEESVARSVLEGRIVAWDCREGEGGGWRFSRTV